MSANPLPPIPPDSSTLGGGPPSGSNRFKLVDPYRLFRQHARLLIVTTVVGVVLGTASWGLLRVFMPWYSSQAQLRVTPPLPDPHAMPGSQFMPNLAFIEAVMRNEITLLISEGVLRDALDMPTVRNTSWYKSFPSSREAREALQEDHLKVYPIRESTLIAMEVGARDENDPDKILTAIIDVYLRKLRLDKEEETSDVRRALVEESDRADDEIRRLQERLHQFIGTHQLTSLDPAQSEAKASYMQLTAQHGQLQLYLDSLRASYKALYAGAQSAANPEATPDLVAEIERYPEILRRKYQIDDERKQLRIAEVRFGENHYWTATRRINLETLEAEYKRELQKKIREVQEVRLAEVSKTIVSIQDQLAALLPKLEDAAKRVTELNALLAQYKLLENKHEAAQETKDQADTTLGGLRLHSQRADARRVRAQTGVTIPQLTFPRPELIIPGVAILILGMMTALIFLREMIDQRIKSPSDIKLLPDVELLGVLPDAGEDPSGPTEVERVVEKYPAGLMAEAFRQVRTSILSRMDRRGYKTLLIVSPQPGCGSSSVTHNLATSLAYNGRRVLVVDANFRRPSQHRISGFDNDRGLVDVVENGQPVEELVQSIEGLSVFVLPTGRTEKARPEILEGPGFRSVLTQLESQYDLILVDAPPALLASDSQMLAKHVDAMVLVIRAGSDTRGMVERMLRQIGGQRADVLGVILNGAHSSAGGYFRQNYLDFYRYRDNGAEADGEGTEVRKAAAMNEAELS